MITPEESRQQLIDDANQGVGYCDGLASRWVRIYYTMRTVGIVLSLLLSSSVLHSDDARPYVALGLAIVLALEGFLRPGEKYAALYAANDDYDRIVRTVTALESSQKKELSAARVELEHVNARLRKPLLSRM